jgi:hypothetical protein
VPGNAGKCLNHSSLTDGYICVHIWVSPSDNTEPGPFDVICGRGSVSSRRSRRCNCCCMDECTVRSRFRALAAFSRATHSIVMFVTVVCPRLLLFCGGWRRQETLGHSGNNWLRQVALWHLTKYDDAVSKQEKSDIMSTIIEIVRAKSQDGGFIMKDKDTGLWWEVGTCWS